MPDIWLDCCDGVLKALGGLKPLIFEVCHYGNYLEEFKITFQKVKKGKVMVFPKVAELEREFTDCNYLTRLRLVNFSIKKYNT